MFLFLVSVKKHLVYEKGAIVLFYKVKTFMVRYYINKKTGSMIWAISLVKKQMYTHRHNIG